MTDNMYYFNCMLGVLEQACGYVSHRKYIIAIAIASPTAETSH